MKKQSNQAKEENFIAKVVLRLKVRQLDLLGAGTFGKVYSVINRTTNSKQALKISVSPNTFETDQ